MKVVCYLSRGLFNKQYMHLESRLRQTANVNLYQVAKSLISFTCRLLFIITTRKSVDSRQLFP